MVERYLADGAAISEAYDISQSTLRTWRDRGALEDLGKDSHGRLLYDVRKVENLIGQMRGYGVSNSILGACRFCDLPAIPAAPVPICVPHLVALQEFAKQALA